MVTEVMDGIAWSLGWLLETRESFFGWRVVELAGDAPTNRRTIPMGGLAPSGKGQYPVSEALGHVRKNSEPRELPQYR